MADCARLANLSDDTIRRALSHPDHPLPHLRVGLGPDRSRRIRVRRRDFDRWLARFEARPALEALVDDVMRKMRGGGREA